MLSTRKRSVFGGISRRVRTLIVAGALFLVLLVLAMTLPVPYVILSPGPDLQHARHVPELGQGPIDHRDQRPPPEPDDRAPEPDDRQLFDRQADGVRRAAVRGCRATRWSSRAPPLFPPGKSTDARRPAEHRGLHRVAGHRHLGRIVRAGLSREVRRGRPWSAVARRRAGCGRSDVITAVDGPARELAAGAARDPHHAAAGDEGAGRHHAHRQAARPCSSPSASRSAAGAARRIGHRAPARSASCRSQVDLGLGNRSADRLPG